MLRESFPQRHLGSSLYWGQSRKTPAILTQSEKLIWLIKQGVSQMPYLHSQVDEPQLLTKLEKKQNKNQKDNRHIVAIVPLTRNFIM